ncbi:TetR/AcrR family transcriptional regulator [Actibacterium sp. 188UL27-1]|uniref:TetR/AcrR family transcriptional regulator n=1 Tax=Actibacterium sp. 188UL27-1 TaxID=2786961 RepID=UPI001958BD36|nr:TetR/AcrR family transcriptional regulator [Actibacterium sp. 188UL27-1]MBM7067385.1 TetR/AcrR family transcriptional regulator [Actibacterium sp. 188UL27-1]
MPAKTKTALLDSAERSARSRGFDGFSYADLAAEVGIRKASIHHHFPTKADLSVALMERYTQELKELCHRIETTEVTASGRLQALIHQYREAHNNGKSLCLCVSFSASRDSLNQDVIAQLRRFRGMVLAWMEATFALGQTDGTIQAVEEPRLEASAMLATLEGGQLAARAEEDPDRFKAAIALLLRRLS